MTERRLSTITTLDSLYDVPRRERARVVEELATWDFDALAAAAGMPRAQLDKIPSLCDVRGTFRTPYKLLSAVCGYGHGGTPATTAGQVLRRLGFHVREDGQIDKGNYNRLRAVADVFGITVPTWDKDGPAVGESRRDDVEHFTAAWNGANTLSELAQLLGQSTCGPTNARNVARAAELSLPAKFSKAARAAAGAKARAATKARREDEAAARREERQRHEPAVKPAQPVTQPVATPGADRHAAAEENGCLHCGGPVPTHTPAGNLTWTAYCSDVCRHRYTETRRKAENLAAKASAQEPCEHCGTHIEPGPKAKRFCSKSCSKKAGYAKKKAA